MMLDFPLATVNPLRRRSWLRHFDNRIGLSYEEAERLALLSVHPLPVVERLLADRPDRPCKAAKTLSESVRILGVMARDNHIDGELFRLFLSSGVYREYGEKFLRPEQPDAVDIQPYLDALDAR